MPSPAVSILMTHDLGAWLSLRTNCPSFNGFWQCPGGSIEEGETPEEAAVRELFEETGLIVNKTDLRSLGVDIVYSEKGEPFPLNWFQLCLSEDMVPAHTEPQMHGPWLFYRKEDILKLDVMQGLLGMVLQEKYFNRNN